MTRTVAVAPAATAGVSALSKPLGAILQRKCPCGGFAGLSDKCEASGKERATEQPRAANPAEPNQVPRMVHEVLRSRGEVSCTSHAQIHGTRIDCDSTLVCVRKDAKAAESAQK